MKVTIFVKSEFFGNIVAHEVNLIEHGTRPYAQYASAPYARFKKKGGRTVYGIQQSYKPFMIIVEGWNHGVDTKFDEVSTIRDGVKVTQSKYMSFDPKMVEDFKDILTKHNLKIIAHYE